jgi:Kef-type K+ transport system membrane component KefB/Trk K+ transport system NAD-binding subunit
MDNTADFIGLLIIAILAVLIPIIINRFRRFRVPIVVAEILAGIVIGRSGLNLILPSTTLRFLAEFGFIFLMFLSGLEVSFQSIERARNEEGSWWTNIVSVGITYFVFTISISLVIGYILVLLGLAQDYVLMGLIMSTTSMGIVVPVLKERRLVGTKYGQLVLFSALISDFVTLLLLSVDIAILSIGPRLDLLLLLVLFALFLVAARVGNLIRGMPLIPRLLEELGHATAQIEVRGALAIMIGWVVLSEALGAELILGAFLAGVIVSLNVGSTDTRLHHKLDTVGYGFFIPIFFITVGAGFDLGSLASSATALILVPILIMAAFAVKLIPSLLFRSVVSLRQSLAAGGLLSARLSLIVASAAIAYELGVVSSAVNSAIILVAIVTCTLSPLIFSLLNPPKQETKWEGTVILGTNQLAALLGRRLKQNEDRVVFIGRDQRQLTQLQAMGFRVVPGEPTSITILEKANIGRAESLVILSNSPTVVEASVENARAFGVPNIVVRVDNPELALRLKEKGVRIVQPAMAVALALEGALAFPASFDLMMDKGDEVEMRDMPLANPSLTNKPLREIHLPSDALIIGIRRPTEVIIPHNDTILRMGDLLLLVGTSEGLEEARTYL